MDRNVNIITDLNENRIVLINDIIFKGKRNVNWKDVEEYLEQMLMLIRHAKDGRMYLYDIMEIKKETSKLFRPNDLTQ